MAMSPSELLLCDMSGIDYKEYKKQQIIGYLMVRLIAFLLMLWMIGIAYLIYEVL